MEFSIQELIRPPVDVLSTMICDKTAEHVLPEHRTFFFMPDCSIQAGLWCILSSSPLQVGFSNIELSSPYGSVRFDSPVAFLKPFQDCFTLAPGMFRIDYTSVLFSECSVTVLITTLKSAIDLMKAIMQIESVQKDSISVHNDTHVFFKISKKILQ
jgi:hypothetical protein